MNVTFAKALHELRQGNDVVLVTIVEDSGSAPRGAGSLMAVGQDGRLAGTIGGGSVEFQSEKMAADFLGKRTSGLHDFMLHENGVEDIGMICGGDVSVWFQYISSEDEDWAKALKGALDSTREKRGGWLVQKLDGSAPTLLSNTRDVLAGPDVARNGELFVGAARRMGNLFALKLPARERALVFGGGHISRALVPLLASVGFRPMVIDNREAFTRPQSFPDAESVLACDYLEACEFIDLQPEDYAVVITHGHKFDFDVELQLLKHDFDLAYIGAIGSKRKAQAVNARLREAGISEKKIASVHTPIGTPIKATTPEEIAVSIVGEMILARAELRERGERPGSVCEAGIASAESSPVTLERHDYKAIAQREAERENAAGAVSVA